MKTTALVSMISAALLVLAATTAAEPPASESKNKEPAIEPDALAALDKMGAFLRDQQHFIVRTTTYTDYVLDSGQKIRQSAQGVLHVRRPDHLRADLVSDRKERRFYYDGKTFTLFSPRVGFYAVVPAPPTIRELGDELEDRYGLSLPLVDLFRWGTDESDVGEITSAIHVGSTKIDGVETDQYAFRQKGLDWQIWIQQGDHPLPRKLLLTTTDDPARPEHAIDLAWDLDAKIEDAMFTFAPTGDVVKIAIAELAPAKNKDKDRTKRPQAAEK